MYILEAANFKNTSQNFNFCFVSLSSMKSMCNLTSVLVIIS